MVEIKNHIFLQARENSTRLPRKVLMKILDKSIIELLVERLKKVGNIDKIILVTGQYNNNKKLVELVTKNELNYFCGSEENLLDRFYMAGKKFRSDNIIRVTAACPLIDFNLINKGLKIFIENNYDLLTVGRTSKYPHGLDFEIFTMKALHKAWKNTLKKYNSKEEFFDTFICPTEYMKNNAEFKKLELMNDIDFSTIRITLDYREDFELITKIYKELYYKKKYFDFNDIVKLMEKNPTLLAINQKYVKGVQN